MRRYLTKQEARAILARACHPTQRAFAARHGLARSLVSEALAGVRPFSPRLLAAIGLKRVEAYEKVKK